MNLHVHRYTKGDRVYLGIHGWGGDHREFAPLAAGAPPGARVLSVDLPGYGRSPMEPGWTLPDVGAALGEILAREGGGTVIGFCSGAILALLAARARPAAATRIVVLDPFGYLPLYFRLFTWGAAGAFAYRWTFGGSGRDLVNRILRRRQRINADFTASFERVNPDVALAYLRGFASLGPLEQEGADVRAPIVVVYGERTFRAVRRSVERMRRLWPAARVECLRGAGHLLTERAMPTIRRIVFEDIQRGVNSTTSTAAP